MRSPETQRGVYIYSNYSGRGVTVASDGAGRPSYAVLEALVREQAARIAELEVQVAELRMRLPQNWRNSSKPPSSDGGLEFASVFGTQAGRLP
jgi:hypothetical protein